MYGKRNTCIFNKDTGVILWSGVLPSYSGGVGIIREDFQDQMIPGCDYELASDSVIIAHQDNFHPHGYDWLEIRPEWD
jgi:hypothetical protein